MEKRLHNAVCVVREKTDFVPRVAIVLGSGLDGMSDAVREVCTIPYRALPDFPISSVAGHKGEFLLGYLHEVPVIVMRGRVHYYEGFSPQEVVLPIRLMRKLGASDLLLTNAAGGVDRTFLPPTLMLITDQISCFVPSPLRGMNLDSLGVRFPDMTHIYDPALGALIQKAALNIGVKLEQGVYCQLSGPQYESPAEIAMLARLGVSAVGMSTAMEAIAARHVGMRVMGISCITNCAAGISGATLDHGEVQAAADLIKQDFEALVSEIVKAYKK